MSSIRTLVIVLGACALIMLPGQQARAVEKGPPADTSYHSTPKHPVPPNGPQECFDNYARNSETCLDTWCIELFFWHVACDSFHLDECMDNVQQTFTACMGRGPTA